MCVYPVWSLFDAVRDRIKITSLEDLGRIEACFMVLKCEKNGSNGFDFFSLPNWCCSVHLQENVFVLKTWPEASVNNDCVNGNKLVASGLVLLFLDSWWRLTRCLPMAFRWSESLCDSLEWNMKVLTSDYAKLLTYFYLPRLTMWYINPFIPGKYSIIF